MFHPVALETLKIFTCTPSYGKKWRTKTGNNFIEPWFEASVSKVMQLALRRWSFNSCIAIGAKTFTTIASDFVRAHLNFCSKHVCIKLDAQSFKRKL